METRVVYSLGSFLTSLVEVGLEFDQDGREFWEIAVWLND